MTVRFPLDPPKHTVLKRLWLSPRSDMRLRDRLKKLPGGSQLRTKGLSTIASDIQAAAFLWSVRRERCDHRVPPNCKSPLQ